MKSTIKTIKLLAALFFLFFFLFPGPVKALTEDEARRLADAGLSRNTLADLAALALDKSRKRAPALTFETVESLVRADFSDELIGKLVRLDRVSGQEENIAIHPAQVVELQKQGVKLPTIMLLVESELLRRGQGGAAAEGELRMGRTVDIGMDGRGTITYQSGGPTASELGQKTVTRPDGRRTIVYFSGEQPKVGKKLLTRSDGREFYLYYAGDPNSPAPDNSLEQEEELEKALKILERIHVNPYRLMNGGGDAGTASGEEAAGTAE
ncbi:MAG: hypothetical protein V1816_15705 [Pseudomonadota bacterium]